MLKFDDEVTYELLAGAELDELIRAPAKVDSRLATHTTIKGFRLHILPFPLVDSMLMMYETKQHLATGKLWGSH